MFVLAFAGGSWLGGFAANGLGGGSFVLADSSANEAQSFWDKLSADRQARGQAPEQATAPDFYVEPAHVCEGCDAAETRNRQLADNLAAYYGASEMQAIPPAGPPQTVPLSDRALPRPRLAEPAGAPRPLPRTRAPEPAMPSAPQR